MQQRTTTAKSIGQVAVGFGVPMVRQRVEREVGSARQRAQSFLGVIGSATAAGPRPAPKPAPVSPVAESNGSSAPTARAAATSAAPEGETLPIPGYDALSASQVVERLAGLPADELAAVRARTRARTATGARFSARSTRSPPRHRGRRAGRDRR